VVVVTTGFVDIGGSDGADGGTRKVLGGSRMGRVGTNGNVGSFGDEIPSSV